nr:SAW1 [Lactuca sativa]
MEVARFQEQLQHNKNKISLNSMSQDYIFNFSHGFERPSQDQQHQNHINQQIRRDKLRVQGFEPPPGSLVGLEDEGAGGAGGLPAVYESGAGMLSEMFNFPSGGPATELLENQINYHQHQRNQRPSATTGDWYGHSAQAMQLFLMNPSHDSPSSQSSSHHHHHHNPSTSSSTLHMLLPNTVPSSSSTLHHQQSFGSSSGSGHGQFGQSTQFAWVPPGSTTHEGGGGGVDSHGLSLSLSSTLQHLEAAKVEELRISDDPAAAMFYFNQAGGGGGSDPYRNLQLQGGGGGGVMGQTHHPIHVGYGSSSLGVVKALRTSRYVKAAQELLEEFCSVGRGQFKINKSSKHNTTNNSNQNPSNSSAAGGGGASSASSKDLHPLSSAERIEHQRRKSKLLSMLDEVDRRYNHYCEQMQMVVNSFDMVMGFGAAVPYTALAQKAMSRHFRCLKDAISAQLKNSCELLGEKDVGSSGVTKGETPRLKMLEQSLRQQRAFHQMGMMEPEAWRPQRGLPERSVNILRAWLFEHFLHPYPSDADKHLLARQTGLSRNQVSNWFINARVRLWKPMVEEMYQQESKEEAENPNQSPQNQDEDQVEDDEEDEEQQQEDDEENTKYHNHRKYQNQTSNSHPSPLSASASATTQTTMPPPPPQTGAPTTYTTTTTTTTTTAKRSEINDSENDPSLLAINTQHRFSENQAAAAAMSYSYPPISNPTGGITTMAPPPVSHPFDADTCRRGSMLGADYRTTTGDDAADIGSTLIRFGTTSGDVSLTLGLRHAGNLPEKTSFFS